MLCAWCDHTVLLATHTFYNRRGRAIPGTIHPQRITRRCCSFYQPRKDGSISRAVCPGYMLTLRVLWNVCHGSSAVGIPKEWIQRICCSLNTFVLRFNDLITKMRYCSQTPSTIYYSTIWPLRLFVWLVFSGTAPQEGQFVPPAGEENWPRQLRNERM